MDNNCKNIQDQIAKLLTADLPAQEAAQIQNHIDSCPDCSAYLKALHADDKLLADFARTMQPTMARIETNVLHKIAHQQPKKPAPGFSKSLLAKLAAAAALILIASLLISIFTNPTDKPGDNNLTTSAPNNGNQTNEPFVKVLKKIEKMYANGDIDGLVAMLDKGQFRSKALAAKYLGRIGDESALPKLQDAYLLSQDNLPPGVTVNPFAKAIEDIKSRTTDPDTGDPDAATGQGATVVQGKTVLQDTAPTDSNTDNLLNLVPADALVCVRINNYDYTLGMVDQYLAGLSPMPAAASMMARTLLVRGLGDPNLSGINTAGKFAGFVTATDDQPADDSLDNIFVGTLMPLADYNELTKYNPNYQKADANGVSTITTGGMANPNKKMLAKRIQDYLLVASGSAYDDLLATANAISKGNSALAGKFTADEIETAASEPLWAFANIQGISNVFGPIMTAKLDELKAMLEQMNASGQGGPGPEVIGMYYGLLNVIMEEVDSVIYTSNPQSNLWKMTETVKAVPGTYLARMFAADDSIRGRNQFLGYLSDGAVFNFGFKMNRPFWEEMTLSNYDLISFLSEKAISDEILEKIEEIVKDGLAGMGDGGAFTLTFDEKAKSQFQAQYILDLEDPNTWNSSIQAGFDLWNTGGLADSMTNIGIETSYQFLPNIETHDDIQIDAVKYAIKATDPNSDFGKMIDSIYSDGFEYRWATIDQTWVGTFACDCDDAKPQLIRSLIDQVTADTTQQVPSEIETALTLLDDPNDADFVGTLNVIRYFNLAAMMSRLTPNNPLPMPQIDMESQSNIAFAGKAANGKMTIEIAMPKDHVTEIKALIEIVQQEMQQHIMLMQSRQLATTQIAPERFNIDSSAGRNMLVRQPITDANQQTAIQGLATFAQLTNGQYPAELILDSTLKEAAEALRKNMLSAPDADPNTEPDSEQINDLLSIEAPCLFYTQLKEDGNAPAYYGNTVTPEFPDAVLLRWKIADDTYRVIFADLTVEDVTAERLEQLESNPLNTIPEAIKPNPADGGMANTISNVKLSWIPATGATEHRVYFGAAPDDLSLEAEISTPAFDELPELDTDTAYYWRVDEVKQDGSIITGNTWTFTTGMLLGWWKFDEGAGTSTADASGGGNEGAINNMGDANWVDGVTGYSLDFDGVDDYVQTPLDIDQSGTCSITLAAWVYPTSTSTGKHQVISTDNVYWDWSILQFNDHWHVFTGDKSTCFKFKADPNTWQHVAAVFEVGKDVTFYKNGQAKAKGSPPVTDEVDNPIVIGNNPGQRDEFFEGRIDDVRVYNYALTSDQITAIYKESAPTEPNTPEP